MRRNNVGYGVEGKIVYKARNAHSMHNGGRNKAEDGKYRHRDGRICV